MNKVESFVYNILKHNPRLKIFTRNLYQTILDLLPVKAFETSDELDVYENTFFGFHDLQPFNRENSLLLSNQYHNNLIYPTNQDYLDVGYIDLKSKVFVKVDTSNTWNFHKGCRLQWKNDSTIIFNHSYQDGVYRSKEINLETKNQRLYNFPIDSISKSGEFCSSFSYGRLEFLMPGYGYGHRDEDSHLNDKSTNETGIRIIRFSNEKIEHFLSLDRLVQNLNIKQLTSSYFFFVTHSLFSTDDNKLSFLLRWTDPKNSLKRFSKLIVYDLNDKTILAAPTDQMVSHYVWENSNSILAYARANSIDAHYFFRITKDQIIIDGKLSDLNSDGHQSINASGEIVVDSYPDARRIQKLYYFKNRVAKPKLLGKFYHPKKFQSNFKRGHICVDLHPRISQNGKMVSFDSAFNGKRNLCILKMTTTK